MSAFSPLFLNVHRIIRVLGKMGEEASKQLYQMWKVQENLRSEVQSSAGIINFFSDLMHNFS